MNSTARQEETTNKVSSSELLSSFSFDSIEIFIQRKWDILPEADDDLSFIKYAKLVSDSVAIPVFKRVSPKSEHPAALSEFIGIRAYNAKGETSASSHDSVSSVSDNSLALDLSAGKDKDVAVSSETVAVTNPPDIKGIVAWSLVFIALASLIIIIRKRKTLL